MDNRKKYKEVDHTYKNWLIETDDIDERAWRIEPTDLGLSEEELCDIDNCFPKCRTMKLAKEYINIFIKKYEKDKSNDKPVDICFKIIKELDEELNIPNKDYMW